MYWLVVNNKKNVSICSTNTNFVLFAFLFLAVLGIEPRVTYTKGKDSTTELQPGIAGMSHHIQLGLFDFIIYISYIIYI